MKHPRPPTPRPLRPFAWSGWLLEVPQTLRPIKVQGGTESGSVALGDEDGRRLDLVWATVTRRRFDGKRFAKRRLRRVVGGRRREVDKATDSLRHVVFDPLLVHRDESTGRDRFVGFVPTTRRVLDVAWHDPANRRTDIDPSVESLVDQPADKPQKWAFFAVSFITPTGFKYSESILNLGDMRVSLKRPGRPRSDLVVRHIYPASLALARGDLEHWLDSQIKAIAKTHRPPRSRRRGPAGVPIDTAVGPGVVCDVFLRRGVRLTSWRRPRVMRMWTINDTQRDRLVALQLAGDPDEFEPVLGELIEGLGWAES